MLAAPLGLGTPRSRRHGSSFDLQLRYRPVTEIDLARMDLWAAQLLVDEAAGNTDGVAADAFAMDYVRDRIRAALDESDLARVNTELGAIQVAVVGRGAGRGGRGGRTAPETSSPGSSPRAEPTSTSGRPVQARGDQMRVSHNPTTLPSLSLKYA